MADNVAITAGSGTQVATDERTIAGSGVHVQRVDELGSSTYAYGDANPTTSATLIMAARDTRKVAQLYNDSTVTVYIGDASVTSSTGTPMEEGGSIDMPTTAAIYGITASGTGSVRYQEFYDS